MEGLVKEYANFLNDDKKPASERFWELEKRIKEDKRHPGVVVELKKSEVIWDALQWRWNWLEFRQSVIFMVGIYMIFWLRAMCWIRQFMMQLGWRQQTMTWTNYISQLNLPREFDTLIFIDESSSKILFIDRKIRQFVNKRVAICKK